MPHIRRMGYLLTLLIGTALATAMVWKPAPPPHFAGVTGSDVPRTVNGYRALGDDPVPPDVKAALASADLLSRTYRKAAATVNFVLIGGTDRSALHDPRSCLIGAGMQIENDRLEALPGTTVEARTCHAVGQPGIGGYDIIYFYLVNGKIVNQVTQIREAMLWSALLGRRGAPVYFLRFTRDLNPNSQEDTREHERLQEFATEMWVKLHPKLLAPLE